MLHDNLPASLIRPISVLLIDNNTGNVGDKTYYRPIYFVKAAVKTKEVGLLNGVKPPYIEFSPNQFVFNWKRSTDLCVYKYHNSLMSA